MSKEISIRKHFITKLFESATFHRWNDLFRPIDFFELDKQAHKMVIAYVIAKLQEDSTGKRINWISLIEGGLFEFLQRIVLTDLKPPIIYKIKKDNDKYKKLNEWAIERIHPAIASLGNEFEKRLRDYLFDKGSSIERQILSAAHLFASDWEFKFIEQTTPEELQNNVVNIRKELNEDLDTISTLQGFKELKSSEKIKEFVNLCGQLRFQLRWGHLNMTPQTSILGHMLIVAILAYVCSLSIKACNRQRINNYFTGLFHDLPEVLTRDVISPVKRSIPGLDNILKQYEKEELTKIYTLIPDTWHQEIGRYTENEFECNIILHNNIIPKSSDEIIKRYNKDKFDPKNGDIVKAVDRLAAFVEAYLSIENGAQNETILRDKINIRTLKSNKEDLRTIAGIDFEVIYADFDK